MWEGFWEKLGRQKIKGNWGSFVTTGIRVSFPILRKVGIGSKGGLRRISSLRGKTLPNNHRLYPRAKKKSNNTKRKRREPNLAKEKYRSENQGVTEMLSHRGSPPAVMEDVVQGRRMGSDLCCGVELAGCGRL
jgi:hypothetical protein